MSYLAKNIKAKSRVEIGFKKEDKEKIKKGGDKRLETTVEAIIGKEVLVLMPMTDVGMVKLPLDRKFEARFFTDANQIIFDVIVLEHLVIDGEYITKLRLDSTGKKVQQRNFYRINSSLPFSFALQKDYITQGEGHGRHDAVIRDLSVGGMSFVANLEMEDGTELFTNFVLGGEYIVVFGRASGKQQTGDPSYPFQYRCQFIAMEEKDKAVILQFINDHQFENLIPRV